MNEVKVSVIMPVYNSEKYLEKCISSVLNQSLREIELICVDDGSTDSSPRILEAFAKSDSRVKLLHQQNLYAGVARNNGMKAACGKYFAFWDSDDFLSRMRLKSCFPRAKNQMPIFAFAGLIPWTAKRAGARLTKPF